MTLYLGYKVVETIYYLVEDNRILRVHEVLEYDLSEECFKLRAFKITTIQEGGE